MSSVADWSTELERRERMRSGASISASRETIARRIGVAPGTLENLARGRSKGVRDWIAGRIYQALINEKNAELRRLTHELEMLRQCGVDARSEQMREVETHLSAVRKILNPE